MNLKIGYFLLFLTGITIATSQPIDGDDLYLNVLTQLENVKKSYESLKFRMDVTDKLSTLNNHHVDLDELKEKSRQLQKPVFDIRFDNFPEHCQTDKLPSNCAEATECTQRSGYYNISVPRYRNKTFSAFCNYNFEQGDWLYVLRRADGSEDFKRSWADYVEGFGSVDNEYWIGLENLYALTNFDGPQELYVYLEDFNGEIRYAKYDHFAIGSSEEEYQLKLLGKYSGNAGDNLSYSRGAKFSTPDHVDKYDYDLKQCVVGRKSGWWYKSPDCSDSTLTGFYYHGSNSAANGFFDGAFWKDFNGKGYSHRNIILMLRRQRVNLK